jgi:hypothetical protein
LIGGLHARRIVDVDRSAALFAPPAISARSISSRRRSLRRPDCRCRRQ